MCCFNLLNFGVICYTADNKYSYTCIHSFHPYNYSRGTLILTFRPRNREVRTTKRSNNMLKAVHFSNPRVPHLSQCKSCSLSNSTSSQMCARWTYVSAAPSTHLNSARRLRASQDCCRKYVIYSTVAFQKPATYQVLFRQQKWRA